MIIGAQHLSEDQLSAAGARRAVALLLLLALSSCRTRPYDSIDPAPDLSGAPDGALSIDFGALTDLPAPPDLAGLTPCGARADGSPRRCATAVEICVFINRGDCASHTCVKVPDACLADRTCGCLGVSVCPSPQPSETFECRPIDPGGLGEIQCFSNLQCV